MTITLSKYLPLNNTRKVDSLFEDIRKSGDLPDADQKRMILFWIVDAGIRAYAEREFDKLADIATNEIKQVIQAESGKNDVDLIAKLVTQITILLWIMTLLPAISNTLH